MTTPKSQAAAPSLTLEEVAQTLGNPIRWRVIAMLATGQLYSVGDLAGHFGLSSNAMSKHIEQLNKVGIIIRGPGNLPFLSGNVHLNADRTELDLGFAILRVPRILG